MCPDGQDALPATSQRAGHVIGQVIDADGSESQHSVTPKNVIEHVRKLGDSGLDPCAAPDAYRSQVAQLRECECRLSTGHRQSPCTDHSVSRPRDWGRELRARWAFSTASCKFVTSPESPAHQGRGAKSGVWRVQTTDEQRSHCCAGRTRVGTGPASSGYPTSKDTTLSGDKASTGGTNEPRFTSSAQLDAEVQ